MNFYLEEAVSASRADWYDASRNYQKEWRLIEKPTRRGTRKEVQKTARVKAHNNELTRQLKQAKARHEQWIKIQVLWNDAKQKMNLT